MHSIISDHISRIQKHFNSKYTDYDVCCNKVVPRNEELQKMLVLAIPFKKDDKLRMLDIGIGTGLTTGNVLNSFPNANIDGIDFSSEMLESTAKRLERFNNSVKLINVDFTKCDFDDKYDVIFSAVSIHNIPDAEKKKLFCKIFKHLVDGGIFINADFIKFASSHLTANASGFYESYLRQNLAGKELEHWLRHAKEEDLPATLDEQFAWLKEAGFSQAECMWAYQNVAVVCAIK